MATLGIASSEPCPAVDLHLEAGVGEMAVVDGGEIGRRGALELPVEGEGNLGLRLCEPGVSASEAAAIVKVW